MIDYVVETNPDDRILARASRIIRDGGLVCFPTETNWTVVADPFNKSAADKLYKLRHVENTKHFTIMVPSFQKAMEIALIDDSAFALIKKVVPGSYTFILEAQKKITKHLKASKYDHQVGIRFPKRPLCQSVLKAWGDVLISTHLSEDTSLYSALIEDDYGHLVDLILDPGEYEFTGPTTIVDFTTGAPEVVREGSGDPTIFLR